MKMYILIKDTIPDNFAPLIAAHASLACYKKFEAEEDMQHWVSTIFKKVVCRVNAKEFENAKQESKHVVMRESTFGTEEVALAFCPRTEYAKQFRFFSMWKPHQADKA